MLWLIIVLIGLIAGLYYIYRTAVLKKGVRYFVSALIMRNNHWYEKEGRIYKYYPLVDEKDCRKYENKSFLQKVYSGSLGVLLSNFLEEETLSTNEIEELERILKEKKEENLRDN